MKTFVLISPMGTGLFSEFEIVQIESEISGCLNE